VYRAPRPQISCAEASSTPRLGISEDSHLPTNTPKPASPPRLHCQQHHHGSWRVPLVTEATKSLSQERAAWIGRAKLTVAGSESRASEKSASHQKHHRTACTASTERCLPLHCKRRRISQPLWDRILLSLQPPHPDRTPATRHNREATPTTIKLRQTRRLHQHVGHPGDPAAMAQPRIIIHNKHNIIHRRAVPPLRLR
jgi:hypothetical protein